MPEYDSGSMPFPDMSQSKTERFIEVCFDGCK